MPSDVLITPASSKIEFTDGNNATKTLKITNTSLNIDTTFGIGTTTPLAQLHINSTTSGGTVLRTDGTNGTLFSVVDDLSSSLMSVNNSAGLPVLEVFADDRVVMGQYGQNNFVLVNNKIGIGTTSPTQLLDVRGNIKLGADSAGNYIYYVKDNEGSIIRTTRTDVTQEGLFRSDGWGNFTFNNNIGVGLSLGTGYGVGSVGSGIIYANGSVRAPIFYDSDNTAYYINPASNSIVNSLTFDSNITIYKHNDRNLLIQGGGGTDAGLLGRGSSGQFAFQVYGSGSGSYGFLDGAWAGWDIRKVVDGDLFLNDNNTYYLNPGSTTNLNNLTVAGTMTFGTLAYTTASRRSKNSSNVNIETVTGLVSPSGPTFLELRGFCPPTMYRTTEDRPAPYGLGFGNGLESGGIMPIGSGDNLQEIMLYGANSGPTTFTFKRQIYEGTTYDPSASNYYGSSVFSINTGTGAVTASTDIRSPIFYDSANTSFYVDPATGTVLDNFIDLGIRNSTGVLGRSIRIEGVNDASGEGSARIFFAENNNGSPDAYGVSITYNGTGSSPVMPSGMTLGGANAEWAFWGHDASINGTKIMYGFRNETNLYVVGSVRSPIFYDSDNTGYYLNPAGSSQLSSVYANDWFRAQGNTGLYFQDKGYGITSAGAASNSYGNASTYGSGLNGWQGWGIGSRHCMMSTGGDNFGIHDNTRSWLYYWDGTYHRFQYGYLESANSVRGPLFYDSNDTTYYVDPASTSRLVALWVRGSSETAGNIYVGGTAAGDRLNINYDQIWTPNGNLHLQYSGGGNIDMNYGGGFTFSRTSLRAPIFYDYNDTGYYCDPNGNSVLNGLYVNAYYNLANNYKDIYVYGDVNTYYVVLIQGEYLYSYGRYSVTRGYNWNGPDTWNTATHKGGLTLDWEWSGDTAWGGNDKAIRIIEFNESYSTMVAGLGYPVNGGVIIWLRGGGVNGALYRIRTPIGANSTVTVYDGLSIANHSSSTSFTAANSAVFSTRTDTSNVSAEISARYPVRGAALLYNENNAVLDQGGTSQTKSGILSSSASLRAPIFYDTDNTGYYLDPNSTTSLRTVGSWRSDSSSWDGEFSGKIQYHANHWYFQAADSWLFRSSGGSNVVSISQAGNVTAGQYYTGGWFRNSTSGYGLYNEVTGEHFYSDAADMWNIASANGTQGLRLRTGGYNGTVRGYFYANSSNDVGFLNQDGSWRVRVVGGDYTLFDGSSARAQLFYDSNNTSYYCDPASTSNLLGLTVTNTITGNISGNAATVSAGVYTNVNNTLTGINYFTSNLGTTSGSLSNPPLQAYASGTNAAFMSFHRGGNYAVNMGLDSDNVLRIGGWSASANRWELDMSGNNWVASSFRAPIFYDSGNTAYYVDPASTSNLVGLTVANTITGAVSGNAGSVTINYNNDSNSTYQMLWGSGNNVYGTAGVYLNPSTDYVTATSFNASDWFRSSGATGWYNSTYGGGIYMTDTTWVRTYNSKYFYCDTIIQAGSDMRSPVYYDANDTAYYVDAASTSNLLLVKTRNTFGERVAVSATASTTINTQYNVTELTLAATITTLTLSNIQASGTVHMWTIVTVGGGVGYSITWPAAVKWPGGTAPTLTTTSNKRDIYQFVTYDGGTTIFAIIVGQNL